MLPFPVSFKNEIALVRTYIRQHPQRWLQDSHRVSR